MSSDELHSVLDSTFISLDRELEAFKPELKADEVGTVKSVGQGVAQVEGLPHAKSEELLRFTGNCLGTVFNVDPAGMGVVLLDQSDDLKAGSEVHPTGRVLDVPVTEALLGRVVDAMGRPLDNLGPVHSTERLPIEREAPNIMDRAPVVV